MSTDPEVGRSGRASRPSAAGKPDRKAEAKTLGAIGVAVLLIVFAVVNSQKVEVDFLVVTTHTPLVVALVVAMLLGFVLGQPHAAPDAPRADAEGLTGSPTATGPGVTTRHRTPRQTSSRPRRSASARSVGRSTTPVSG